MKMFWIMKFVRYFLTALGTWLVAQGYATEGASEEVIGALTVIVTFIWSVIQTKARVDSGRQVV